MRIQPITNPTRQPLSDTLRQELEALESHPNASPPRLDVLRHILDEALLIEERMRLRPSPWHDPWRAPGLGE